jgi:hypothetical protein
MKRIIRLTESDLARIVKRVINEQDNNPLAFATDPNYMDYAGFNKSSKPSPSETSRVVNGELATAGYTDTDEKGVDFYNFMSNKGFDIIDESENIDNEIQNTDGFYPRYKKNIDDYTIYVILKMKNPRQTSRISVYDSEGFDGGEDIKYIEERGEDPIWDSFTSYKIDYDRIKDSLMGIMGKYIDTGTPIEESYTRSYRRYRRY